MANLILHAVECGGFGVVANRDAGVGSFAERAGTAMLRDQDVALGLRFGQFLLQPQQRALEVIHLSFLIVHLLPEILAGGFVAHGAL